MNFGITPEHKTLFTTFIENGGTYDQARESVFEPLPVLSLLKLHTYFNWADKKMHTAFFIDNKDQINEDLLADFKGGNKPVVQPGLASAKPAVKEEMRPKGIVKNNHMLDLNTLSKGGFTSEEVVDVNSRIDFPTFGSVFVDPKPKQAAAPSNMMPCQSQASTRGRKGRGGNRQQP